ncbi:MAG: signal recognition particle protein [Ignavibacteriae bacterium]|nr:signal recognition particle protein [Ignavibacteria bacterium]MBI3365385.1 signal recognition particle protein [Ignavibacteriota bacterium]
MFEDLSQKLEVVFKRLRGQGKISEANISESLREVRRVLLDADVNYKVAKQFIDDVQKRAVGQEVLHSITPGQLIVKIIYDELVKLMGSSSVAINISPMPPTVIMVAGLQGSGKTTFCAKLANHLKGKGRFPILVAADVYRPAAIDQLEMLGKQIQIPVVAERGSGAIAIAEGAIEQARKAARDVIIIDTAGRLHVDEEMMREIETMKAKVHPHEILFVVDSMTGQDAVNTAKAFHDRLNFDGVVLTKLDGDTRGGAALSIRAVVNKPIKFVGVGEKLDALEVFHPDRMASRILGMGDIVTFVEKAQTQFDETKARKLEEKLRKSQFTFEDFLDQLREIKKMGSLQQVMSMIPGLNRLPMNAAVDDKALVRVEAIIQSMTSEERLKPNIINGNRRRRIAYGSGTSVQEVNKVLKQFIEMQKMMKTFSKGKIPGMLRGMQLPG